jgi:hypothetical protein
MYLEENAERSEFSIYDLLPRTAYKVLPYYLALMCRAHLDIITVITSLIFPAFDPSTPGFRPLWKETVQAMEELSRATPTEA